jgi:hypothetical protein
MTITDKDYYRATMQSTISEGLAMANRDHIFWTQADAMQSLAMMHKANRKHGNK